MKAGITTLASVSVSLYESGKYKYLFLDNEERSITIGKSHYVLNFFAIMISSDNL